MRLIKEVKEKGSPIEMKTDKVNRKVFDNNSEELETWKSAHIQATTKHLNAKLIHFWSYVGR